MRSRILGESLSTPHYGERGNFHEQEGDRAVSAPDALTALMMTDDQYQTAPAAAAPQRQVYSQRTTRVTVMRTPEQWWTSIANSTALWIFDGYRNMLDVYANALLATDVPFVNANNVWPVDGDAALSRSTARADVASLLSEVITDDRGDITSIDRDCSNAGQEAAELKYTMDDLLKGLDPGYWNQAIKTTVAGLIISRSRHAESLRAVGKQRVDTDCAVLLDLAQNASLVATASSDQMESICRSAARLYHEVNVHWGGEERQISDQDKDYIHAVAKSQLRRVVVEDVDDDDEVLSSRVVTTAGDDGAVQMALRLTERTNDMLDYDALWKMLVGRDRNDPLRAAVARARKNAKEVYRQRTEAMVVLEEELKKDIERIKNSSAKSFRRLWDEARGKLDAEERHTTSSMMSRSPPPGRGKGRPRKTGQHPQRRGGRRRPQGERGGGRGGRPVRAVVPQD